MPPKLPQRGGESGTATMDFPHSYIYILAIGTSQRPYKDPPIKSKCRNYLQDENKRL